MLVGFVALQWAACESRAGSRRCTTAIKFVAFLALIAARCYCRGHAPMGAPGPGQYLRVVAALQLVSITYAGWQGALYFTEEDRDPARNLPRALIGSVLAVIVV